MDGQDNQIGRTQADVVADAVERFGSDGSAQYEAAECFGNSSGNGWPLDFPVHRSCGGSSGAGDFFGIGAGFGGSHGFGQAGGQGWTDPRIIRTAHRLKK